MFPEIEGRLMVTLVTINKTVMVDDTNNEIEYIRTYPPNLERTPTSRVKQEEDDSEPFVIDLLGSSENEISGDELQDMEEEEKEEEEEKGKEELPGMSEDDLEPWIMPITNNVLLRNPPSRTVDQEEQDFKVQKVEELDEVNTDFNYVAVMELEGANDADVQALEEDQAHHANVDW
jgi:hypothetical protein